MSQNWTQALDESSGLYYYYNVLSGETSWENPVPAFDINTSGKHDSFQDEMMLR